MTNSSSTPYPAITGLHLGLTFVAAEDSVLSRHKGSTLRNLIDTSLYRLACSQKNGCRQKNANALNPTRCPDAGNCSYTAIAYPFNEKRIQLPAAYLLKCSNTDQCFFKTGERLFFEMQLFGDQACRSLHLLKLIAALDSLDQRYFSLDHFKTFFEHNNKEEPNEISGRLRLEKIEQLNQAKKRTTIFDRNFYQPPIPISLAPHKTTDTTKYTVTITFTSPTHIERKTSNGRKLLTSEKLDFPTLFRTIRGRYQSLSGFNLPAPGEDEYEDQLWQQAYQVPEPRIQHSQMHRITRRKNRDKINPDRRDYHGFSGSFTFDRVPVSLISWLQLGKELHIGKLTTFGYGEYHFEIHKNLDRSSKKYITAVNDEKIINNKDLPPDNENIQKSPAADFF